ncbi:FAD-linked oxidase [Frigoribacterium sp. Leaf186]|nr:FAD-linked oxidase [Frigoribacterium sp. Leaf186]
MAGLLADDQVLLDADDRARYRHDRAEWADHELPLAVVLARSTADVVATVRWAADAGVRIVPRGAGTGLSGGANAIENCVVLSLEEMTAVTEIDVDERFAVVQPGVINDDLRTEVATHGLWYPPDPASSAISTMGGNVATNAGGLCCVKYGVTRDHVLGLTVVLADGEVVELGRRTAKGVAGWFPSLEAAGDAVAEVARAGIVPAALELIDHTCLVAVDEWLDLGLPVDATALLLARVDEPGAVGAELSDRLAAIFASAGGTDVEQAADPAEVDRLFQARRLAYPALERLGPVLTEDVCVPRRAVPEMLRRIQATARDADVTIANIAHAGDGNLHPLIIAPIGDDAAKARAKVAFDRIVADCLDLGGTVTGEHGVGLLKRPGLHDELGPRVLAMHRSVKDALDPTGLLNPGKAF